MAVCHKLDTQIFCLGLGPFVDVQFTGHITMYTESEFVMDADSDAILKS